MDAWLRAGANEVLLIAQIIGKEIDFEDTIIGKGQGAFGVADILNFKGLATICATKIKRSVARWAPVSLHLPELRWAP